VNDEAATFQMKPVGHDLGDVFDLTGGQNVACPIQNAVLTGWAEMVMVYDEISTNASIALRQERWH
jgi:hypothetical protein